MPIKVEQGELIRRALESALGDVWTSFPGQVVSYDASTQTADVAPVIRRPVPVTTDDTGNTTEAEDLPVIPNVPICFPRGGGDAYTITWPIQAGDWVAVQVATYSFAGWRRTGQTSDPGDVRAHALGNCFAIPCMAPNDKALAQANDSDHALVIHSNTLIKLIKDASAFVALANLVNGNFDTLKNAISSATPTPGDGGAALKAAILSALNFQDVSAQHVKAK